MSVETSSRSAGMLKQKSRLSMFLAAVLLVMGVLGVLAVLLVILT